MVLAPEDSDPDPIATAEGSVVDQIRIRRLILMRCRGPVGALDPRLRPGSRSAPGVSSVGDDLGDPHEDRGVLDTFR